MTDRSKDRPDAQILDDVFHELHRDARVDETEVGVQVNRGIVTLRGTVTLNKHMGNRAKKLAAEEAAQRVAGVRDVVNDIQVQVLEGTPQQDAEPGTETL